MPVSEYSKSTFAAAQDEIARTFFTADNPERTSSAAADDSENVSKFSNLIDGQQIERSLGRARDRIMTRDTAWTAVAFIAVMAAAALGRQALEAGWRATADTEPPISPSSKDATWAESLTWGVLTGAIIGVIRALSLQGARSAQRRWG